MRLLKREKSGWFSNANTFSLTKFDPPKTPQYAILSHRWGADEITFQDIQNGTAKTKVGGFKKLEFCAEQAAKDGLMYFWIDTCCIDKSSSAELSEAINSMFKWYKNATRCYVYLPDVPAGQEWELAFPRSEWFNRGWTLQELIAPTLVEFFSFEGTRLGDKKSLEREIHQITGIAVEALQGKPLCEIDEKERFAWTVRRRTTVEEDAAYCLLGIFDIQMPLIYGEGQQKALARLQRKISKSSLTEKSVTKDAPWIVPFERNPHFTGRETELAELEDKLFAESSTKRFAITGLGGAGKTQLVLELLYRTKKNHKDCLVIWIPATTAEALQQGYLTVAQQLEIPGHEDGNSDVKTLVQDYLSTESVGPWLLVFDNADDIDLWMSKPTMEFENTNRTARESLKEVARLIDYLPKHKQGCILFTTRDRKAAVKFAQQNIITVPEMNRETATQLLSKALTNPNLIANAEDTSSLLAALTYLPLAITQAAAYINANEISLADYVSLLEDEEEEVIDVLSEEFEDLGRYPNIKNPIATTWLISFELIQQSDPLAAEYLSFIACIDSKDIPQSLLPPGPSRKKEIEAIGTLTAYSFISRRPANDVLDLHRLVHLTMRNWLRKEGLLSMYMDKAIVRLEEVFPESDYHQNKFIWRQYLPHVRQVLESNEVSEDNKERMALLWKYANCLSSDGRWNEAEAIYAETLAIEMKTLGNEDLSTLSTIDRLASTFREQGRWEEAEQLQLQVMEAFKTKLGVDHLETLSIINNLALTYSEQGRWQEAEQLLVQVMEVEKTKLGIDHLSTLIGMSNLALMYLEQGRLKEAEQLEAQVMEIRKTKLGIDHLDTLMSMNHLSEIYREQARLEEAEQLAVHLMEARTKMLGIVHPDTLTSMSNVALVYRHQGRLKEAEQLQLQVIEIRKTELGVDHPDILTSMNNLASIYWKQDRLEEAEQLQVQVIEARTKKLGIDHPDTLITMSNLARLYWDQGRLKEAEKLELQVLESRKLKLGFDHPNTLASMHDLAFTWKSLNQVKKAVQLMKDCVQHKIRVSGAEHPSTLSSQKTLEQWEHEDSNTDDNVID